MASIFALQLFRTIERLQFLLAWIHRWGWAACRWLLIHRTAAEYRKCVKVKDNVSPSFVVNEGRRWSRGHILENAFLKTWQSAHIIHINSAESFNVTLMNEYPNLRSGLTQIESCYCCGETYYLSYNTNGVGQCLSLFITLSLPLQEEPACRM